MAGTKLNIISSCARSPYFKCTRDQAITYGDHEGRLTPLSLGRSASEEYWILRKTTGLFDVPERPLEIIGPDATAFLNKMFTRAIDSLKINRGRYGLLCHQDGGLVCDGVLFKLEENRCFYVHADRDIFTWFQAFRGDYDVQIRDPHSWALQIQGPNSLKILAKCCDQSAPSPFGYFHAAQVEIGEQRVLISPTVWTGELGFEIYNLDPNVDGPGLWHHLLNAGHEYELEACGTLSMNPRRIEAGILNYGTDMGWETTPFDVGLGHFVDLEHDFIGRDALKNADPDSRLCGFKCSNTNIRWHAEIRHNEKLIGRVQTHDYSPYLKSCIGFVLFDDTKSMQLNNISVIDRDGGQNSIELVELPFYDKHKRIPKGLEITDFDQDTQ